MKNTQLGAAQGFAQPLDLTMFQTLNDWVHFDRAALGMVISDEGVPLIPMTQRCMPDYLKDYPGSKAWLQQIHSLEKSQGWVLIPSIEGKLDHVVVFVDPAQSPFELAELPAVLPVMTYRLRDEYGCLLDATQSVMGWVLGCYQFDHYKAPKKRPLLAISVEDAAKIDSTVTAIKWVRDMVNCPAETMTPQLLAHLTRLLAKEYGASCTVLEGDEVLEQGFPLVHAVGRASVNAPCLIQMTWGNPAHPKVVLVGKGVCFDTGGLDLKDASGMLKMKKDMGGAAHVLGLAGLIMANQLPISLSLIIPAVENSVSGASMRPGDIFRARNGLTVEIGNTDAEGRLILADALTWASEQHPDLILDFATLTGAARVALGPELPVLFSNSDEVAHQILDAGKSIRDLLWQLPLHTPYATGLDSKVADLCNVAGHAFAGAIMGALFLHKFVNPAHTWCHVDVFAWNAQLRPGRPEGGEAQGLRAMYAFLAKRYQSC